MTDHAIAHNGNGTATRLQAPVRNRWFYGKLLDERHLTMEQEYGLRLRRLGNRLAHGAGVLCGLDVTVTEDGKSVWVGAGVAFDDAGREIVVPEPRCVEHPDQPTDACGRPHGDPVTDGGVLLCLAYHECDTEPAPVLVGDCHVREECRPSAVRERYRLLVRAVDALPARGLSAEQCAAIFPASPPADFDRRRAACTTLSGPCEPPAADCVPLALLTIAPDEPVAVDACAARTAVYSNTRLFDLVLCLAARVDECCATKAPTARRVLHYVSGDAQTGEPDAGLTDPVVVEVRDENDQPVAAAPVTFRALGGAGAVADGGAFGASVVVDSGADGRASARWQLGPVPGLNTLEATIESGGRIAFHALSAAKPPPFIEAIWPPNGQDLDIQSEGIAQEWAHRWMAEPVIELTFDRPMTPAELDDPDPWLRAWRIVERDDGIFDAERVKLARIPDADVSRILDEPGSVAQWRPGLDDQARRARWVVQVRAEDPASPVHADGAGGPLLDPDFAGTGLTAQHRQLLWDGKAHIPVPADLAQQVPGGASLEGAAHSGDGTPGGRFHTWFATKEMPA